MIPGLIRGWKEISELASLSKRLCVDKYFIAEAVVTRPRAIKHKNVNPSTWMKRSLCQTQRGCPGRQRVCTLPPPSSPRPSLPGSSDVVPFLLARTSPSQTQHRPRSPSASWSLGSGLKSHSRPEAGAQPRAPVIAHRACGRRCMSPTSIKPP